MDALSKILLFVVVLFALAFFSTSAQSNIICVRVCIKLLYTINTLDCSSLDNQGCDKCINDDTLDVSIIQYIVISRNICCTHFASLHSRVWYILSSVTGATLTRNVVTGNGQVVTCCQLVLTAVDTTGITSLAIVSYHSLYDLMLSHVIMAGRGVHDKYWQVTITVLWALEFQPCF